TTPGRQTMSDTERVRAWRDRLKQEGRVAMTIWVSAETKARYEDLALTYHRSPSELAQQALDAYRPDAVVSAAATDTAQLRTLIQAELATLVPVITDSVTATVTATLLEQLRALGQAASVSATVTDSDTATGTATATATDTATVTIPPPATATDTATVPPPEDRGVPRGSKQSTAPATDTLPIR